MLLRATPPLLLMILTGCAASAAPPCPAPQIEVAPAPEPKPEPASAEGLSEEQRTAQRIAKACVRGEARACQSIATGIARPADGLAKAKGPESSKDATRRDEEAAIGQRLLEAAGPERLSAPDHLEVACELGHAGACNDLGWAWANGFGTLKKDDKRAGELYEQACDLGSNLGCLNRGRLARSTNKGKAARYMAMACDEKLEKACVELAGTVAEAEAACKKDASECTNWGFIQERGYGTPADDKLAFANFERACSVKDAVGCFNAGIFVRDGRVGKADAAGAKRRFDASCKAGHDAGCRQAALSKP